MLQATRSLFLLLFIGTLLALSACLDWEIPDDYDSQDICVGSDCETEREFICSDGFDNDGDFLEDCYDSDCEADPYCFYEILCSDGYDNDADGVADCYDLDCFEDPFCW